MGRDDEDAARKNRQFNKKPLEFNNEKEEYWTDVAPVRYIWIKLDLLSKKKMFFLNRHEVEDHYIKI